MTYAVRSVQLADILPMWQKLWENRSSPIESHSAMRFLGGDQDVGNFELPVWFRAAYYEGVLVGVNSGHLCIDGTARSRGLWVEPEFRGKGIGSLLLFDTISQAACNKATAVWSFPRRDSWSTYVRAGFHLASEWVKSETSPENAYCSYALPIL